jgi:hypothetical protein
VRAGAGERPALPVTPALAQPQTRELRHQVELARPHVANLDRELLHAVRPDDDPLARDALVDRIVARDREVQ